MKVVGRYSFLAGGQGFLAVLIFTMIPVLTRADELSHDWPQNLADYLKSSGNCVDSITEPPSMSGYDGPVAREYIGFIKEQVCRSTQFKKAFEANPNQFCPGLVPKKFGECYSKILNEMVAKAGLNVTGFMLMHAGGV